MNRSTSYWLATLAVVVVGAALTVWFLNNFERVNKEYHTGYGAEAKRNAYLAAERFLSRTGLQVQSVRGREIMMNLPPAEDVIITYDHNPHMVPKREEDLQRWIEAGGHLITVVNSLWDEDFQESGELLLDRVGVRQFVHDDIPPVQRESTAFLRRGDEPALQLAADFLPRYYMVDDSGQAHLSVADSYGIHVLQYAVGDGMLTVLTDDHFLRNSRVQEHDHAFLLRYLTGQPAGEIWLLFDTDVPTLPVLIWIRAPEAVVAGTVLLLFMVWALYNRFGPPLMEEVGVRRSLMEHLQAAGRFRWRRDRARALRERLRQDLDAQFERQHPGWRLWDPDQRVQRLAERSGMEGTSLRLALYDSIRDEATFTRCVQALQQLRKQS